MDNKVLSIDIGILNFGYVFAEFLLDKINVLACDNVDITWFCHKKVPSDSCNLHHSACVPDYLDHFIQEHNEMFESADIILIERQPITGLMNVQDYLFVKFRDRVVFINPCTIHKYFYLSKDYYERKIQTQQIAYDYIHTFKNYIKHHRKHDMADAMVMLLYYYNVRLKLFKKKVVRIPDFEQFRFIN